MPTPSAGDGRISGDDQVQAICQAVQAKDGVEVLYASRPITGWRPDFQLADSADVPALLAFMRLLQAEVELYPPGFAARTRLKRILVVKKLHITGQDRTAIPDTFSHTLILDFKRGSYNPVYVRHCIHHEHYHMIEEQFHGTPYFQDSEWAALEPGFQYGRGGYSVQWDNQNFLFSHPAPGFFDSYAQSAIEEDKAENFAALFIPQEAQEVDHWAKQDRFLAAKVAFMKAFLRRVDPAMDEAYWARLRAGKP